MAEFTLRDKACIVGVGNTAYTKGTDKSQIELHVQAALNALADAGLSPADVDGVVPNAVAGVIVEQYVVNLGLNDVRFTFTKHMGGASMAASILDAAMAVAAGMAKNVLFVGGRLGYSAQRISTMGTQQSQFGPQPFQRWIDEFEKPFGNVGAADWFSAPMRRHMHEFGTKPEQFGALAVACRKHACLNPNALMRKPMTIEDYVNSKVITAPIRLFDCSLETDGAAAFVITSAERARDLKKAPVYVMGTAEGHPDAPHSFAQKQVMTELQGVKRAAKRAFEMAGVSHRDIDFAEMLDGYTYTLLSQIEDLGFCKKGEGGAFVEGGRVELGGELPLNTSGGALSEAHVSGFNHLVEAVRQLRGECGERQVRYAQIGLMSSYGDFGDGGVAILRI